MPGQEENVFAVLEAGSDKHALVGQGGATARHALPNSFVRAADDGEVGVYQEPCPADHPRDLVERQVTVFPDGSHERIWYGMAMGCAIATDFSRYLAENFSAGESILFWPKDGREIAEMAAAAVADLDHLREMTAAAGAVYAAKHT